MKTNSKDVFYQQATAVLIIEKVMDEMVQL